MMLNRTVSAIVSRDYLLFEKVIQEVIDVMLMQNIVLVVACWKREREETEWLSFYIGLRATLTRKCGS